MKKRIAAAFLGLALATCFPAQADEDDRMWEEMEKEGFDDLGKRWLSPAYLPMEHNTATAINEEINSADFKKRLGARLKIDAETKWTVGLRVWSIWENPKSPFWNKHPEEHFRMKARMTRHHLWTKANGLSDEQVEQLVSLVERYVETRLAGHTKEFTSTLMEPPQPAQILPHDPLREKLLASHPEIPTSMLVATTNTVSGTWVIPDPEASGGNREIDFVQHVFRVVDGPITWEYLVSKDLPNIEMQKHDSQEDDPAKAPLIDKARKEVAGQLEQAGIKGQLGACYTYWAQLKKLLKEKHSIDWLSPQDLHPSSHYD